jgi:DNA polymerase-3 subunit epsilon
MFGISIGFDENNHLIITTSTGADRNKREKGNGLLLTPSDYTAIDIETTGFDCRYCDIIEIGAIRVRNNVPVELFQSLVHISEPLDGFITSLTGITVQMLKTTPILKDVLKRLLAFVGDDILVGQ